MFGTGRQMRDWAGLIAAAAFIASSAAGCGRTPSHLEPAMDGVTCYACHGADYLATEAPDHVAFELSRACQTCHSTTAWSPADVGEHVFWSLTGAHATVDCASCHTGGAYADAPRDCAGCHEDDYVASTNPSHVASGFPRTCETCHTTAAWRPADFDHQAMWPLTGAHAAVACEGCHPGGVYAATPTDCAGCHLDDYQATVDPNHAALGLPTTCDTCHSVAAWQPADFDIHDRYWPLEDKHATVACTACHADGRFAGTPRDCEGCHLADYQATTNPDHEALALPTACGACHTAAGWQPASFDDAHDRFWPIEGRHTPLACESCHAEGAAFSDAPRACEGCHLQDYQTAADPDHVALELPTACGGCHTAAGWSPAGFDAHDQFWPLEGSHAAASCESCHGDAPFSEAPRACEGCHMADYQATTAPNHAALALATACAGCHTADGWSPAGFDVHDRFWPLAGKHAEASCESCHADSVFDGTPRDCQGCHLDAFLATTDPPHAAAGYPKACEVCHDAAGWEPATFEHATVWPLDGQHALTTCESCHADGVFAGTPRTCDGCHEVDWQTAGDPDHVALDLSKACESCHATSAWSPATFPDHDSVWPLEGSHAAASCESCHAGGTFAGTSRRCVDCHLEAYQATTAPAHVAQGIPTACEGCHTPQDWSSAFDHAAFWPLAGAHEATACVACHADGVFAGTARDCAGCHLPDYQTTTSPAHAAAGISTLCEGCHTPTAWVPAAFDHATIWPLTGGHAGATCDGCHGNGVYAGTPTTCQSCHLADWQASQSPPHATLGYPKTCETCHSTGAWSGSTFDHAAIWPLEGPHAAATCTRCHAGDVFAGTPTDCAGCHLSDYQATTDPAHAAAGFPLQCEACHSGSSWVPATFDHDSFWPLTGRHAVARCESCHAGGVYAGTPTTCVGCHRTDYDTSDNPSHPALSLSTTCQTCHTTSSWDTTTFPVHDGIFRLSNTNHSRFGCADCHKSDTWSVFTCTGCHTGEHEITRMNDKHSEVSGYRPAITTYGTEGACLHCHPDGEGD